MYSYYFSSITKPTTQPSLGLIRVAEQHSVQVRGVLGDPDGFLWRYKNNNDRNCEYKIRTKEIGHKGERTEKDIGNKRNWLEEKRRTERLIRNMEIRQRARGVKRTKRERDKKERRFKKKWRGIENSSKLSIYHPINGGLPFIRTHWQTDKLTDRRLHRQRKRRRLLVA